MIFGDSRSSTDGFFSSVSSGFGEALGTITQEVLPVWAARELGVQMEDQLSEEMYNEEVAPPANTTYRSTTESSQGGAQQTGVLFDNINVSGAAILGVAVAVVAGIALAKM